MAEDGGLFSGLKFTDLFLPAAATIASAYNPYIGRGLQTGMNLFNTFQDFQQSARYYKELKEQKEREQAGADEMRAGIDQYIGTLRGRQEALPFLPGDPRQQAPLVDESETSKFTLFGDEGPMLADPNRFSLHQKELEQIEAQTEEAGGPAGMGLGLQSLANPKFSEFNTEAIAANSVSDLEKQALEALIAQQQLNRSFTTAAPGVAAQGSSQGAFEDLSSVYRNAARRKDLLAAFEQQDRSAELAELERQAQLRQIQAQTDIYSAENQRQEAAARRYAEDYMQGKGPEDKLSYSEQMQAKQKIYSAFLTANDPDASKEQKDAALKHAVELAMDMKNRGHEPPSYMNDLLRDLEAQLDGTGNAAQYTAAQDKADEEGITAWLENIGRNARSYTGSP